jgi:pimeloyl-ACP methyl ester carboxylesterase
MSSGRAVSLYRAMTDDLNIPVPGGRRLRVHDTGAGDALTLIWHHGSPQTGAPLAPLLDGAARRDIRLVSYGRPSYGGSTPQPGRDVASAAKDVQHIADALGLDRFAVMGASGGGPHALACAALLGARIVGAVCLASLAPYTDEFDWFAGMQSPGGLRAARDGRAARAAFAATDEFDEENFTAADYAALAGPWASLGADAVAAGQAGPDGLIDDDVAFVAPWGFDVAEIAAPVLVIHGDADRVVPPAHAHWLADHCPPAELLLRPDDGHVSVLAAVAPAMDWLLEHAAA